MKTAWIVAALAFSVGCHGSRSPGEDFVLTAEPASITAVPANLSQPFNVTIEGRNGFVGPVSVEISGLPPDAVSNPMSPFAVEPGHPVGVQIAIPSTAVAGTYLLDVKATAGSRSHQQTVVLAVEAVPTPRVRTYQSGDMLYLESTEGAETARVGINTRWGGAITEASLNGTNYVNHDDPGRQVQVSLWDGNDHYEGFGWGTWGYNPVESGDHFFQGSPLLAVEVGPAQLYTGTQPIQWAPELYGGGWGTPVAGDAYIEKWITVTPGLHRVFQVHYRIRHLGSDVHATFPQELPVMYVNPIVPHFVHYGGGRPWTHDELSYITMPATCCVNFATTEGWGAYVDDAGVGLALFTPGQFPQSKGFDAGVTLQFTPLCPTSWGPGTVLEFDTFLLLGPVTSSRDAIYALHLRGVEPSALPPFGYLNLSTEPQGGVVDLSGWAWSLAGIARIDVLVNGIRVGSAEYGLPASYVTSFNPGAPENIGYSYLLDTRLLGNGTHEVVVEAVDVVGRTGTFKRTQMVVSN